MECALTALPVSQRGAVQRALLQIIPGNNRLSLLYVCQLLFFETLTEHPFHRAAIFERNRGNAAAARVLLEAALRHNPACETAWIK